MKKIKELLRLIKLYLAYHMNKITFIILGIVLLIWCFVLIINANIPLEMDNYILSPNLYHNNYLEQSIFFLSIIDGVFVSFLIGIELSSISLFDPMFVPYTKRNKIVFSKIFVNFIILFIIITFQILLLFLIGVLVFPDYSINNKEFLLIFKILLPLIELLLIGEALSVIFNSYFISILIFIIHILTIIISKVEKVSNILSLIIPQIKLINGESILIFDPLIYTSLCLFLFICITLLFQKKDISYT